MRTEQKINKNHSQYHLLQGVEAFMPTNKFWRTGAFSFLSISAILMQLFHRLRALQVGIVPFTRNTYKLWTFIFGNSADPLRALRRTSPGHSSVPEWHDIFHAWNEQATHFVGGAKIESWSRICRASYWKLAAHIVKRAIHHWIQNNVCIGNPWGKNSLGGESTVGRANWKGFVVTKDWFIGRKQHRTINIRQNISNFFRCLPPKSMQGLCTV